MKKTIKIDTAHFENGHLRLITNDAITDLTPRGHMLVDSDHLSFVYIMEDHNDYTYIVLPESIWPVLKESVNKKLPALLVSNQEQIELISFQEELEYVINNIKGNGNYGSEMVEKVEKTF